MCSNKTFHYYLCDLVDNFRFQNIVHRRVEYETFQIFLLVVLFTAGRRILLAIKALVIVVNFARLLVPASAVIILPQ